MLTRIAKIPLLLSVLVALYVVFPSAVRADLIPLTVPLVTKGFEKIATKEGIRVYKHRESEIIRLGAEGRLNAPVQKVMQALLDYRNQVGKIDRLSEARVLRRGKQWLLVYQRLNLPVISDRDFTLRVKWGKRDTIYWIRYWAVSNDGPGKRDGVVRVSNHHGSWQLKPIKGGQATQVRFQVTIDMGGWLPKWLAKSGSGKEVPQLFAALDKLAQSSSYFSSYRGETCSSKCL